MAPIRPGKIRPTHAFEICKHLLPVPRNKRVIRHQSLLDHQLQTAHIQRNQQFLTAQLRLNQTSRKRRRQARRSLCMMLFKIQQKQNLGPLLRMPPRGRAPPMHRSHKKKPAHMIPANHKQILPIQQTMRRIELFESPQEA